MIVRLAACTVRLGDGHPFSTYAQRDPPFGFSPRRRRRHGQARVPPLRLRERSVPRRHRPSALTGAAFTCCLRGRRMHAMQLLQPVSAPLPAPRVFFHMCACRLHDVRRVICCAPVRCTTCCACAAPVPLMCSVCCCACAPSARHCACAQEAATWRPTQFHVKIVPIPNPN
mgnify:CR=1 FL=1